MVGFTGNCLETSMNLAFMKGFSDNISMLLQPVLAIETLTMGDLLSRVSVLTRDMAEDTVTATSK